MNTCPYCQASQRQLKVGRNRGGSQPYSCRLCQRYYTPRPSVNGYDETIRRQAVKLYVEGTNFRRIGRLLSVNHQSVVNWVNAYHASLPVKAEPAVGRPETVELDEVFTFSHVCATQLFSKMNIEGAVFR